jgi:hypothetical protein
MEKKEKLTNLFILLMRLNFLGEKEKNIFEKEFIYSEN